MKKFLRYFSIFIGVAATIAVVAFIALYFLGARLISTQRTACMESEDFVVVRSNLKAALKDGTIDQPAMERENKIIARAQEACALGDKVKARAMLMSVMMDAAFQSDNVYERKVNGKQGKEAR